MYLKYFPLLIFRDFWVGNLISISIERKKMCQTKASYKNIFMRTQLEANLNAILSDILCNYNTYLTRELNIQGLSFHLTFHLYLRISNVQSAVGVEVKSPEKFTFIDN